MANTKKIDYSLLDNPMISSSLFYPRSEWGGTLDDESVESILVPVENGIVVGARFHMAGPDAATILFFHGNGEIVADYDEFGIVYNDMSINFFPVDYRGYGRSTGTPTVTALMWDCHTVFAFMKNMLKDKGYKGPVVIMGRSLGSAPALELASCYRDEIDGLIIDSGFAYAGPLLGLFGIDLRSLGISEEQGFSNLEKMRHFDKPTLVIHAEFDHIISLSEGELLFGACPAREKRFVKVEGANHNDIFVRGLAQYLKAVEWLVERAEGGRQSDSEP
ncbi:MAG TPA: alpha/beta hydrolase [Syntrophales bacterium]|nr:alpha/beta hydrolase [Syntrophales bacterium]